MANEIRVRSNFQAGTITDNPLTNVATTVNSAAFAALPAIGATQHLPIVLDPLGSAGAPEIAWITAHTASATSATVVRAQEGTAARQHASGTVWRHAPTIFDYDYIATSGTRPATPYYGQIVYETDTDTITARSAAGAWQTAVPLGAWTTWTPTLTNLTLGNGTLVAKYCRIGRAIHWRFKFTLGSTSAVGSFPQTFTLPVAAHADYSAVDVVIGLANFADTGTAGYVAMVVATATGTGLFIKAASPNSAISATVPFTWTTGDIISATGTYEAAS